MQGTCGRTFCFDLEAMATGDLTQLDRELGALLCEATQVDGDRRVVSDAVGGMLEGLASVFKRLVDPRELQQSHQLPWSLL